tara:strand:- start:55 stop:297 length:243 start_codon:yes stop_codon:yes gene_type:complete
MKKSRIIRAIKKYNSEDLKKHNICRFEDEKGKSYFLGEENIYMQKIQEGMNLILHKVFEIIDDSKLKNKILKKLKDDKTE